MTDTSDPFVVPIATDPTTIRGELVAAVRTIIPGFTPAGFSADLIAGTSQVLAEGRSALKDRIASEVKTLVGDLFRIPRPLGSPAVSTITVTARDALGHADITDGVIVYVGDIQCRTRADLVIAPGHTSGSVAIETVEYGSQYNGADGPVSTLTFDWIEDDGVVLDDPLDDGTDIPDDAAYGRTLRDSAQNFSDGVLQPPDAVRRAMLNPAVGWAYAIENWDAQAASGAGAAAVRINTLVITKADGTPVASPVLDAVQADIDAKTVGNWIWRVVSPTYVPIDIEAQISPEPGWETVAAGNAAAALIARVSPGPWITPRYSLDPTFVPGRRVHQSILIAAAKDAQGVAVVDELLIAGDEILLDTPTMLPTPGTIDVTLAS